MCDRLVWREVCYDVIRLNTAETALSAMRVDA